MIALKISNLKDFMEKLLKGNTFDHFWLVEASITTFNTFTIDGNLHLDFFDSPLGKALDAAGRTNSYWAEVKPFCFSIMKGKRTPLHFKIVFQLSFEQMDKVLTQSDTGLTTDQVAGLYLNLQYNGSEMTCTTGTSLRLFTLDKSLDILWDNMILRFFTQKEIAFEKL